MSTDTHKRLVLTALEKTWGESERILFLGEWCKLYERRHIWGARNHETISFHWDDRSKLERNYQYLKSLHHSLLAALTDTLNEFHQVNHSIRYWQILLDPWLLSYVSVLFDRWENLRIAFAENSKVDVVFLNDAAIFPSFSYSEFITDILSDNWNQSLYQRIIESEYLHHCMVITEDAPIVNSGTIGLISSPTEKNSMLGKLALAVDRFLGHCSSKSDVLFFMSNFNLFALLRLNLDIAQVPRLFLNEFKLADIQNKMSSVEINWSMRKKLSFNFKPQSEFETFVKKFIKQDLPSSVIEGYDDICQQVSYLTIKTKAIITASAHWNNIFAKFWFATQVNSGTKLVVLEHGGSFPAAKELFDFEEDIADVKGTWFLPYHEKHVQVPPSKLVCRYKKPGVFSRKNGSRQYCSVIGSECSRWVHRCHFYPMGAQCLMSFDLIIQLYENVHEEIKKHFKVKPYSNQGVNTSRRYEDVLGTDRILLEPKIDKVFALSQIVVCTYPETTFSEAMASGVPTIMLYPKEVYERHPAAQPLLDILCAANIIFHDAECAAVHLNEIWNDPNAWWNSSRVWYARTVYEKNASNIITDWRKEWVRFINAAIEMV